jgi:hypothetical protein
MLTADALVPGETTITTINEKGETVVTTSPIIWYVKVSQTRDGGSDLYFLVFVGAWLILLLIGYMCCYACWNRLIPRRLICN